MQFAHILHINLWKIYSWIALNCINLNFVLSCTETITKLNPTPKLNLEIYLKNMKQI